MREIKFRARNVNNPVIGNICENKNLLEGKI